MRYVRSLVRGLSSSFNHDTALSSEAFPRALLVFGFLYYMKPSAYEAEAAKFYDEAGDMELTEKVYELAN